MFFIDILQSCLTGFISTKGANIKGHLVKYIYAKVSYINDIYARNTSAIEHSRIYLQSF